MTEPIPVVLADDDEGMRLVMRKLLERSGGFALRGEARDGKELLELVQRHRPQLVLLDVEMPEMSGVECARVIQDTDPATILIFATAHDQYMGDAFSVYAFDYLLKPFKVDRALQTLERVKQVLTTRSTAENAGHQTGRPAGGHRPSDAQAPRGRGVCQHGRYPAGAAGKPRDRAVYGQRRALCDQRFAQRGGGAAGRPALLPLS